MNLINTKPNTKFNLRAAGVAFEGERILLHRAETDNFWTFPGGRVELLEPAAETVRREMQEELGTVVRVERLLWLVENFFEYNAISYHEICFYFLITFAEDFFYKNTNEPFWGDEQGLKLIFQWFTPTEIDQIVVLPSFFKKALKNIPAYPEHIVHNDESD